MSNSTRGYLQIHSKEYLQMHSKEYLQIHLKIYLQIHGRIFTDTGYRRKPLSQSAFVFIAELTIFQVIADLYLFLFYI